MESDDLYTGPTLLAPGASHGRRNLASRLIVPLLVLFVVVVLVFYVFFTSFTVRGESMEPTLRDGDRLLITKGYDTPGRGDVVVFATLDMRNREEDLVKRVVAVQGDSVEVRQGIALVNGAAEPTGGLLTSPSDSTYAEAFTVPPGNVYVMGDNRPIALDSRSLGPVPVDSVKGEVVFIYAPIGRVRSLR